MGKIDVYYDHLTPLHFLARSASVYPDKPAVIYGEQRYTYSEMRARVNRLGSALNKTGIRKGDRVAFLCPNIPPMLEAHYGVPLAGAILVPINIRLSSNDILYILNHSGSKVLFVDTELAPLVIPIKDKLETCSVIVNILHGVNDMALEGMGYESFLQTGSPEPLPILVEDEYETITINYTSGTTGRPKGVMYHHRGAYLNAIGEVIELSMDNSTNYLWVLPMFHCKGWCFTWGVTAIGGTHICLRKFDPEKVLELIQKEHISHMSGAPTVWISLINHPNAKKLKLSRPLIVATAGAAPSPTLINQMEALGARMVHIYGLTETYGPHTVCAWRQEWDDQAPNTRAKKKVRQGVPYVIANTGLRVVDEKMNDVPADGRTMGEVVMRGNNVMKGYYQQPEATAEVFRGGWFHSGDLAVMHPDGYIELRDRKKDVIISGGENISSIEVEQALVRHPAVLECAVIAIPDDKWGEVPKAFVAIKPGMELTEDELIAFSRENLAKFKCPKAVEFGDLPKTSTGKIQKTVLRERE